MVVSDISGPTGCRETSVASYKSATHNIPEEERRPERGNLKYREKVFPQIPHGSPWDRIRFGEANFKILGSGGQEYSGVGKHFAYASAMYKWT